MLETLNDSEFVAWCYQRILGRSPDSAGEAYYRTMLKNGAARSTILQALVGSEECRQNAKTPDFKNTSNEAFVLWCFQSMLQRAPRPEELSSYVTVLEERKRSRLEIVRDFLESAEYQSRMNLFTSYRFVPPGHFYSPIPSDEDIERLTDFEWQPTAIAGVDLAYEQQLTLLNHLSVYYKEIPFTAEKQDHLRYYFNNPSYSYCDGILLYSMIRHLKPQRIIEVGSGSSSCVILDTNDLFFDGGIECRFIEPYPEYVLSLLKGSQKNAHIIPSKVQDVSLDLFKSLRKGDILLIDSTHVSKLNSDVNDIFFRILPALHSGVFIHFHDIFFPFEYSMEWLKKGWAWNEQYMLRAFLQFNTSFKIALFSTYMMAKNESWFQEHMPDCLKDKGGCLWIEKQ